ncbi:DegV family protein [Candidatus Soleaferrea massiliensis]|uniref:DegV family protein n=1 Tax=Candidatus Soleaferrea massiliensis TaxID=1470354 RepID=UPI00058C80E2|nr:DegV family protein [Candidatus Soleaferrea massiliensis]
MGNVIITSDSTCDLSPELLEQHQIITLPLYINLNDHFYRDGVDITPDDIYENYKKNKTIPKTSAIPPGDYLDFFAALHPGENEIVHFSISSGFSTTHQNACMAAKELGHIHPIDSRNLSTGIGLQVLYASDMARNGASAQEIVEKLADITPKVDASFILDTLEYMCKGGRCSSATKLGANLLRIKPCIEVKDGGMIVGKKYRGKLLSVFQQYCDDRLRDVQVEPTRAFVTHSGLEDMTHAETIRRQVLDTGLFKEVHITRAGCTVSTHCGINTLGVLFIHA